MPEESANSTTSDATAINTEAEAAGEQPTGSETQTESGGGRSIRRRILSLNGEGSARRKGEA